MTIYSKINIIYRLQKWMDSVPGQTFLNYAYSWGASIVILGTLFKLTHLPGANFFLFLGMGTEVFVFFISAFDRPFDKTADGMELDIHTDTSRPAEQHAGGGTIVIGGGGGGNAPASGVSGGTFVVGGSGAAPTSGAPASGAPVVDSEAIAAVSSSVISAAALFSRTLPSLSKITWSDFSSASLKLWVISIMISPLLASSLIF